MTARAQRNTTARGLGWAHQKVREQLLRAHHDGSPCWWCNRPMWLDALLNWDHRPLAADHTHARANGGTRADRLLHSTCNKQRGDGSRDDQRPAATNQPAPTATGQPTEHLGHRAMAWP